MQKYRDIAIDSRGNAILSATITVTNASDNSLATIYSDNGITQISGSVFTSSGATGAYEFYAADGRYNITVAKTGYDTGTIADILLNDQASLSYTDNSGVNDIAASRDTPDTYTTAWFDSNKAIGSGTTWTFTGTTTAGNAGVGLHTDGYIYNANGNQYGADEANIRWFGAVGDSSTDDTASIQAAVESAQSNGLRSTLIIPMSPTGQEYLLTSKITISGWLSIQGIGSRMPRILCSGCTAFEYAAIGITYIKIDWLLIAQAVRYTTTPNSYRAFDFLGDTSNRPYWSIMSNLFLDGFGTTINLKYCWEFRFYNVVTNECNKSLQAIGICANNFVHNCSFVGEGIQIVLGDGTTTIEGWHITDNFFDGGQAIDAQGAAYCVFNNNTVDHVPASVSAVLFRAGGVSYPSIGNHIKGNYIAFTGSGNDGIRLNNTVSSSSNMGSIVEDNEIFYYGGGGLTNGILIDGSGEDYNLISKNRINADTADCKISAGADHVVTNNKFLGAGFSTTKLTEYTGNQGTLITSQTLIKRTAGLFTETFSAARPTTGSYVIGDVVHKTTPSINASNMVNIGWKRLTTGSAHVDATDWANMYVSQVSPAT